MKETKENGDHMWTLMIEALGGIQAVVGSSGLLALGETRVLVAAVILYPI